MGREVRRVALDFDWPVKKAWPGFINPHYRQCRACDGTGSTTAYHRLDGLIRLLLLSADDVVRGTAHPYFHEIEPLYKTAGMVVSGDMVDLAKGLGGSSGILGHSSNNYAAVNKVIAAAGLPETWGNCPTCAGEGTDPSTRAAADAWDPTDPPDGDGWQMWETTSEGSPISPVLPTAEGLAHWLADNKASAFGSSTATYDEWLRMIMAGWAPSTVMEGGRLMSGVEAVGHHNNGTLTEDELETILIIARNDQSGRITNYEVKELVRGYLGDRRRAGGELR